MMHKHNDKIIWMVKHHIVIEHLIYLTNFHQYGVFATSPKKGRIIDRMQKTTTTTTNKPPNYAHNGQILFIKAVI